MVKSGILATAVQILPSLLAVFLYLKARKLQIDSVFLPFYLVGMIGLVRGFLDLGLSRSFLRLYPSSLFSKEILNYFFNIYIAISSFVFALGLVWVLNDQSIMLWIVFFLTGVAFSQFLDVLLMSKGKIFHNYFIDALFWTFFYISAIFFVTNGSKNIFAIGCSISILALILSKFYILRRELVDLRFSLVSINNLEYSEIWSSFKSSVSVSGYKQLDRIIIISNLSPVLYSFYQICSQVVAKIALLPTILARALIVNISSGYANKNYQLKLYSCIEIFNLLVLLVVNQSVLFIGGSIELLSEQEYFVLFVLMFGGSYSISVRILRSFIVGNIGSSSLFVVDITSGILALITGALYWLVLNDIKGYLISFLIYYMLIYIGVLIVVNRLIKGLNLIFLVVIPVELFRICLFLFGGTFENHFFS